ncbi:MAG: hypothetical protein Q9182_000420 [Xanthomendoza sp. 2 TL-2023]
MGFNCSQHQCWDCSQKTQDAGGMIFRCRWCERGYCEDCLDFTITELLGDDLKEYELLGFPAVTQAYYISCPSCTDHQNSDASAKDFFADRAMEIDKQHDVWLEEQDAEMARQNNSLVPTPPSDTLSLTDASTIDGSTVATPYCITDDGGATSRKKKTKKRKAAPASFNADVLPIDDPAVPGRSPYGSDTFALPPKKPKTSQGEDATMVKIRDSFHDLSSSSPLAGR